MAGTAVVAVKQPNPVVALIDRRKADISALLPAQMPSDRFIKTFKATILRQPDLLECDPQSVLDAVTKAAQDGLIIDGREAAIVTFKSRKRAKNEHEQWVDVETKMATYIPMRNGLIKRIRNTGEVSTLDQTIVYDAEIAENRFAWRQGDDGYIKHDPIYDRDPGEPVLVYSIARLRDGSISRCVMRKDQVEKIKARSRSKSWDKKANGGQGGWVLTGPWATDEEEMWKKTCLRRHSKDLPMDADIRRIFESDTFEGPAATIEGEAVEEPASQPVRTTRKRPGAAAAALNTPPPHDAETGEVHDAEFSEARDEQAAPTETIPTDDQDEETDADVI